MRKLLLTLIFFITPVKAFALQDYILFSDIPVKSAAVEDKSIINVYPVQTIDNLKKTIFIKSKKQGKTTLIVITEKGANYIDVNVKSDETVIKKTNGFEVLPADMPPESLKIDGIDILPPPKSLGGSK